MAKRIVIDPGHGKNGNKSPNNAKYIEGTQMWHLANKLKIALENYGFEVITTRPNITDNPSLYDRGSAAGKNGCCMFLSLHSNAPGRNADGTYSESVTGSVLYYSMTDAANKVLSDKLGKRVSEIMGHNFRGSKTRQYPGKPGVDYYGVIRASAQSGCKCAMLIEHGFHTNIKDSNFLLVDANLQKLAEAEAAIIAEHFGQNKQPEKTESAPAESTGEKTLYRVQVGAYSVKSNADAMLKKLKAAGYEAFIAKSTGEKTLYRVQVGAYSVKSNADAMLKKLKAAGYEAFIAKSATATPSTTTPETPVLKSVDEIAKEVIKGKWGNGADRKNRLTAAGYNYSAVQAKVNELMKK